MRDRHSWRDYKRIHARKSRIEEGSDSWVLLKLQQLLFGWELWPIALAVHHAKKAERLVRRGAELVPSHGGYEDKIGRGHFAHLAANKASAAPPEYHYRVGVFMPLKRRMAA